MYYIEYNPYTNTRENQYQYNTNHNCLIILNLTELTFAFCFIILKN